MFAWRRERLILLAKALEVGRVYGEGSTGSCWREEFSVQESIRGFPGGPVAKVCAPHAGGLGQSLVRELDPTCCTQLKILHAMNKTPVQSNK